MASSFPPPVAGLRDSTSKLRLSLDRLAVTLPPCAREGASVSAIQAYHESLKTADVVWETQDLVAYTNAFGMKRSAGEAIGGSMRNCNCCHSTMFRKERAR